MTSVCVLGLGYIGLPTAIVFAQAGLTVLGVDVKPEIVEKLKRGELTIEEDGLQQALSDALATGRLSFDTSVAESDAYIITAQTPQRPGPAGSDGAPVSDLSYVRQAARDVGAVLKPGQLVILESTVPPLTTRMVRDQAAEVSKLSTDSFMTAHCPERVIPGRILTELRENDRIVGADRPEEGQAAEALYRRILTKGSILLTDTVTAELCKLSENTFRDINIAYANELSVICHKLGVDVYELIRLANRHPRVNIHMPGIGVGGHCIAVDPWFIHESCPEQALLIGTARRVNDRKPSFVAGRIAEHVPQGRRVCVLGLAYKPDVDDLRESPAIELCKLLSEQGFEVCVCEPHAERGQIGEYRNLSLDQAIDGEDFLVLAVAHTVFKGAAEKLRARDIFDCVGFLR